ncbi:ABC transporter substrate-binding protein [Rhodobium gokarnense]|uniref:Hydroxymethylpyrimidine transport system substrate-binding protein n=1 Tax=Rhodobium gokarnense TaxID=364296 RepID=A0ABT3H763_9HYPH|nr:ABC transporter substrate-binding protein [Rhodobium gokarnense]MCW2306214.1 putative hydroxymethylpyrimidine transport system substrate-binding protein [Rhodobium gokarnense]
MKRLVLALATALAVTLTSPALAADKLTVLLDWFVNPDHAPLVIAKEAGYFDEEGLDVTLVPPADPSAPPRLVAAGKGDIAISYQPNLYQHVAEGLPLVRFGTLVETPLNTVVALADGPVKEIADLKGKKVGFSVAGFEDAILGAMLKNAGLTMDDVELVNVNFALSPALLAGRVDAVVGSFRNFELTQLELEGSKGRAFYLEEHGVPVYDELIYLAHRDHLDDARLRRFLAAVEKASIFLTNHPEEARQMFLKAHPDLDNELNRRAFMDTIPRFAKRPAALDSARYKRFAAFMKTSGLIDEVRPVGDYAVELE